MPYDYKLMNKKLTINKIKRAITSAKQIAVISHQGPDGDALGSLTALAEVLQIWQKPYSLFCVTPAPETFTWLPNIAQLQTDPQIFNKYRFDLIIIIDSGSLVYAGVAELLTNLDYKYQLLNIDHHASNNGYGDINYVDIKASSTCEIIYNLIRAWQFPLNKNIATSLLNGIMTDTGMLTNPATSDHSLIIASRLMKFGANIQKITTRNMRNKSTDMLKLWGIALERLVYNPDLHSVATCLTQEDFKKLAITSDSLDGLANFLSQLKNVNFTMVLVEQPDQIIKGSLRTTLDNIDVSALAAELGGGGHRKAAGFTISGKLLFNENGINII